jgi:hypothetical protein
MEGRESTRAIVPKAAPNKAQVIKIRVLALFIFTPLFATFAY